VLKALTESDQIGRITVLSLRDDPTTTPDTRYTNGADVEYRGFGKDRFLFTRVALQTQIRKSYDLLLAGHVNLAPLLFVPLPLARGARRRITFIYGTDAWDRLPRLRRNSLIDSDLVVAISQFTAGLARAKNGLRQENLRVLHNCLDPTLFTISDGAGLPVRVPPAGKNIFLTVARISKFEAGKGHVTVIRALPTVLEHVPDAEYWVVGEGDLRPDLERLAAHLGVAEHVRFLGRVDDSCLGAIYGASKIFVMPCKFEGFGFVFLEAMAQGLPIVAGNRDASPEVLGDAGILVDPDDPAQVAVALTRLLRDSELRNHLGALAKSRLEAFGYDHFRSTLASYVAETMQIEPTIAPRSER
jgi:phosphatidyl-myo-inositol dimannoside synthase